MVPSTSIQLGASPVMVKAEPSNQVCVGAYLRMAIWILALKCPSKAVPEIEDRERMPEPLASTGSRIREVGEETSKVKGTSVASAPLPALSTERSCMM